MGSEDNKRLLIAVVGSMLIVMLFQMFYFGPEQARRRAQLEAERVAAAQVQAANPASGTPTAAATGVPTAPGVVAVPGAVAAPAAPVVSPRVKIDAPMVEGSLALNGGIFDQLSLKDYRETIKPDSPNVSLLRDQNAADGYFAFFGWAPAAGASSATPGPFTAWSLKSGDVLSPGKPIVLTYSTPDKSLTFDRTINIDDKFMFTVRDTVTNASAVAVTLHPYSAIRRNQQPPSAAIHHVWYEGPIGVLNGLYKEIKYKDVLAGKSSKLPSTGGWLGITDQHWLTAIVPATTEPVEAEVTTIANERGRVFQASTMGAARQIAPGGTTEVTTRFFAGAKRAAILRDYEKSQGIKNFDKAIHWGMFGFLTRPFFLVMEFFGNMTGNWGVAILLLTVVVKVVLFPLNNSAYGSMAKMRVVAPKMKELQDRYKDDKTKLQTEMQALFQKEKLNPLAGCLPILLQMPIFFALYKVISISLELRHAPFFGWIQDLSAPEGTSVVNLFGLLPFDPSQIPLIGPFLMIGICLILYGATMAAVQALSAPPPDPAMATMFKWMPWVFMFLLVSLPVGAIIYWVWSNVLTFLQQYVLMRKHGVETELDKFIAKRFGKSSAPAA
jgi:YidC/Oxa1 family membrane protein insertase